MTYAEYLAHEATADVRHEYIHGEIYAMTGGTSRHAAIGLNVGAALKAALRGKPCR
ncbi:MAG: Uma2 family endonuclease, partial [Myxococcales bacterium]|nr:Uma2 family endonuclease [Myxococcales bacterium]